MNASNGGEPGLAPVIPLFVGSVASHAVREAATPERGPERASESDRSWHPTWVNDDDNGRGNDSGVGHDGDPEYDACGAIEREPFDELRNRAESTLLKRLRTRQLSVAEARAVVAERDLCRDDVDDVIEAFCRRGYLDDARLAEQLVYAGVDRRGQGRRAIGLTLTKRGIPRDIADAALATLPDDDADRALEFARTRARGMTGLDRSTAERRLAGQLSRRGYGSVALSAARQALDELSGGRRSVRFD